MRIFTLSRVIRKGIAPVGETWRLTFLKRYEDCGEADWHCTPGTAKPKSP